VAGEGETKTRAPGDTKFDVGRGVKTFWVKAWDTMLILGVFSKFVSGTILLALGKGEGIFTPTRLDWTGDACNT
jgi:hypothetical protein